MRPLVGAHRIAGPEMLLFEDTSAVLTFAEVSAPERAALFQPNVQPTPYFGFTKSTIWVRLDLSTAEQAPHDWFLEIAEPLLHEVEIYGPVNARPDAADRRAAQAEAIPRRAAGRLLPFREREVAHRKILFPITLSGEGQTFYIKIRSRDNVVVPVHLWPRRDFFLSDIGDTAMRGLFYGIIAALIAYNCFLFLSLLDRNYLYYILYAAWFAVFQSSIDGSFYQLIPDAPALLKWRLPLICGSLSGIFMLFFTRNFLFMVEAPAWLRHVHWIILSALLCLLGGSFSDTWMPTASRYANVVSTFTAVYGLSCGMYRTWRGYQPARYYLVAWLALLSGITGAGLVNLGFFPPNLTTKYLTSIGFVAELLLFSFALADRITLLRKKKEEADQRAIEAQQRAASELEVLVKDRTRELSYANATKDKFFSIIAHDLRGPIGSLSALLTEVVGDDGVIDAEVLRSVRGTTKNSYHLLEDLLLWARSQRGEIEYKPEAVAVEPVAEECITLLGTQARSKGIRVTLDKSSADPAFADRAMIGLVLRNLISNALKFTPGGGEVKITVAVGERRNRSARDRFGHRDSSRVAGFIVSHRREARLPPRHGGGGRQRPWIDLMPGICGTKRRSDWSRERRRRRLHVLVHAPARPALTPLRPFRPETARSSYTSVVSPVVP